MKFKTSNKIFAHIDCDSFFASCEIFRNPILEKSCVCVGGEIIVAACYNAKRLGVKTGTPIWEAKKMLGKKGVFLSPDMEFYGKLSKRIMAFIQRETENVEIFSIDEAFCEITGIPEYHKMDIHTYADYLKHKLKSEVGIPVSIGISNTRIKAKMFSKINKPFGVFVGIDAEVERNIFSKMPVGDIPFIGPASNKKFQFISPTIYDFKNLSLWEVKKRMGKNGTRLWFEINGVSSLSFKPKKDLKSITRTRSFNKEMTSNKNILWGKLNKNIDRLMQELILGDYEILEITLVLIDKDWEHYHISIQLTEYTNERNVINDAIFNLFESIHIDGKMYRKTGISSHKIKRIQIHQLSLFKKETSKKSTILEKIINEHNRKYGKKIISFGIDII